MKKMSIVTALLVSAALAAGCGKKKPADKPMDNNMGSGSAAGSAAGSGDMGSAATPAPAGG